jgi:hypothetical protein
MAHNGCSLRQQVATLSAVQFAVLVVLLPLFLLISRLFQNSLVLALIIIAAFAGYHFRDRLDTGWRVVLAAMLLLFALVGIWQMLSIVRNSIVDPPEWDFLNFWHWGSVAVQGYNIFDPAGMAAVELPVEPSQNYVEQVTAVGFFYPPPSIFLFMPLGLLSYKTAYGFWAGLHGLAAVAAIYLLWRNLLDRQYRPALGFAALLLFMLPASLATVWHAQTNFLLLLLVLLFWQDYPGPRAGVWLALAVLVKPYCVALLLLLLLARAWRAIGTVLLLALAFSLAFILFFGLPIFVRYFTASPIGKRPSIVFFEEVNQSLLAELLRLSNVDFSVSYPLFLLIAMIVILVTVVLIWQLDKAHRNLSFALVLVMSLLLYPQTLVHYGTVLIIPLLVFYQYDRAYFIWTPLLSLLLALVLVLTPQDALFWAHLITWQACAGLGIWLLRSGKPAPLELR